MKATTAQITKIQILITQLGLREQKEDIVSQFSATGQTSTKQLTLSEASNLLKWLTHNDPLDRMRNKVFALAYEVGMIYGDTLADKKMNGIKLDKFLTERGAIKKRLSQMNKQELIKTVNQFESIVKHREYTKAGKAAGAMLKEMNIKNSFKSL